MCGIAGIIHLQGEQLPDLEPSLQAMNEIQKHRGPDGQGVWAHPRQQVGFAHRRLSIIDLHSGQQPMTDGPNCLIHNGEIYNYIELRNELGLEHFKTTSDTEVILKSYSRWGSECLNHLRGMFAFALWDEARQELFCARDRFGIKPFYYTVVDNVLYFASEIKTLLAFRPSIETDLDGFKDYLAFQFCLSGKTLFRGIHELLPGHSLRMRNGQIEVRRYWEVYYELDWHHTERYFEDKLQDLLQESAKLHMRADVPLGVYLSGGLDSSIVACLANSHGQGQLLGFHGKFSAAGPEYDESQHARAVGAHCDFGVHELEITAADFLENIRQVIYHLDYPVAGPGSFPQYMVSQMAAKHRKVVLGGQGGDEIFGGYTRYLVAYFEQCIKAAIEGTAQNGNFVVTYESIIPNLSTLRDYKPMLQDFWREGLFESMDRRYFRLVNRSGVLQEEINWDCLTDYSPFESFQKIFKGQNVGKESYFDQMTHFDFKTLLPALLQVEDRVSMAHGLESRVPFLDHPLVELAATIPSNIKFRNGALKNVLKHTAKDILPQSVFNRQDKMGFPTPINQWAAKEAKEFIFDVFSSSQAQGRALINNKSVLSGLSNGQSKYGRKLWGLLCLELWQQEFHDKAQTFRDIVRNSRDRQLTTKESS